MLLKRLVSMWMWSNLYFSKRKIAGTQDNGSRDKFRIKVSTLSNVVKVKYSRWNKKGMKFIKIRKYLLGKGLKNNF